MMEQFAINLAANLAASKMSTADAAPPLRVLLQRPIAGKDLPCFPVEIPSGSGDVSGWGAEPGLRLCGVTARESADTPAVATVILRHGGVASDQALEIFELAANATARAWYGEEGIDVPNGVFIDRVAGSTHLTLLLKIVPPADVPTAATPREA